MMNVYSEEHDVQSHMFTPTITDAHISANATALGCMLLIRLYLVKKSDAVVKSAAERWALPVLDGDVCENLFYMASLL